MSTQLNSISINGIILNPAPFVSTSYEYNFSGNFIIGGKLIVTLDGTLASENIVQEMYTIGQIQSSQDCVELIIGCDGNDDFLSGSGRITSIDISATASQPFLASYTITLAIETIGGQPAVKPDPGFLAQHCLNESDGDYLVSYSETLSIDANINSLGLVDDAMGVSKSFIKGNGSIKAVYAGQSICGVPSFVGSQKCLQLIQSRASSLMNFEFCGSNDNPLKNYSGWNKWLDTKSLQIDDAGTVAWSFDLYMSSGGCAPYAWVDINTEDNKQYQSGKTPKTSKTISGTIRGLSSSTSSFLGNKSLTNERLGNAKKALGILLPQIIDGNWPGIDSTISGEKGQCISDPKNCDPDQNQETCYQRISSNLSTSVINGEIRFNAEYADINACKPLGEVGIDVTIEENLPAVKHTEFIIPSLGDSVIHHIGDTPHTASVTVRGSLKGCDTKKINQIIKCVDDQFVLSTKKYNGWLIKEQRTSDSTYSYSKSITFIKCNSGRA